MSNTIPTAARARRSIPAPLLSGMSTSPASSTATTTNASVIGRTSVFQCGCKISTDSSPTERDRSYAIPDMLGLLQRRPRDVTALAPAIAAWLAFGASLSRRTRAAGRSCRVWLDFWAKLDTKIRSARASPTARAGALRRRISQVAQESAVRRGDDQGHEGDGGMVHLPGDLPASFAGEGNTGSLESYVAVAGRHV